MFSKTRSNRLRRMDSKKPLTLKAPKRQPSGSYDAYYESLENRQLLAWDVSLNFVNALSFTGPADTPNNLILSINSGGYVQHNLNPSGYLVSNLDLDSSLPGEQKLLANEVQSVAIFCNNSAYVDGLAWNQVGLNITGSQFDDIIVGSSNGDYIDARGGNDMVWGLDGNDQIFGDSGNDLIYGGAGNDKLNSALHADFDDDTIYGEAGDDEITLGYGHDYAYGGSGTDYLVDFVQNNAYLTDTDYTADGTLIHNHEFELVYIQGSDFSNQIDCSAWTLSPLTIYGSGGDDSIIGGHQGDWIYGGYGNDSIAGNDGADSLEGEDGDDSLSGGNGADLLRGGLGFNSVSGGTGNDSIFVSGYDSVDGGSEVDTLYGWASANSFKVFQANGGDLNGFGFQSIENIRGGASSDTISISGFGSIVGTIDLGAGSDTVDLTDLSGPLTVDKNINSWIVAGYTGRISNAESFHGNGDGQSKVSGDILKSTWRVGANNTFSVNRVNFNNFRNLETQVVGETLSGGNEDTQWILLGLNNGIVQSATSSFVFSGFANLSGGVKDDVLIVQPTGSLSGNFNGGAGRGAVTYSSWSTGVSVNLATQSPGNATAIGGALLNVTGVIGGSGDDTLIGVSNKSNVLIGNNGNDTLTGGGLRDIIFGGLGADTISGGNGDDLLVGGKTSYDNDLGGILSLLAEWTTNARTFQQRCDNIYGPGSANRLNGNYFLNSSTVADDATQDAISGGNGQDWFFAQLGEISDFVSGGTTPDRRN